MRNEIPSSIPGNKPFGGLSIGTIMRKGQLNVGIYGGIERQDVFVTRPVTEQHRREDDCRICERRESGNHSQSGRGKGEDGSGRYCEARLSPRLSISTLGGCLRGSSGSL